MAYDDYLNSTKISLLPTDTILNICVVGILPWWLCATTSFLQAAPRKWTLSQRSGLSKISPIRRFAPDVPYV